ncbi:ATP synthase F0 subunit B [Candidatus Curtissbacteria bacterium RIFCSPLOWO2_02_FULL_40_13b]|uniref:ATP synthase subunit b n=3 Tax=Candidatus Curtissiibacteriota TaxID=1752717 RepID=A0A1F5HXD1_9BACT|nr:MAG: ATP synthase F0 subunit B [Candidatus Curtissbacteria bacterium RIFCSPHIGHO2_01_FULL_40_12]OGE04676.1 MAG: ATP synthase F0 subunit B [Candidatus Curtissbacteria bacterium RIFCSPHIGHO2_12_FULL_41_17]OGE08811.1 MAG: ATP synthase F0 subunit B [Candidatus Curtissbacteria bacterium RIFCSPLOWO2_02_FULL_40_13b]
MEILKNFGIQPTLLLAQIVNFLIILFLLKKFFYKPITKALEDRKKKIEESLVNAQLIEEKLAKTEEQTNQILEQAKNDAQNLISGAKEEAQRIADQATAEARQTIDQTVVEAKSQIEAQKVQMQKELEQQILNLVVDVVKKVLGRTLKDKERHQLTQKAILEITKQVQ